MSEELPPPAEQDAATPWWVGHPASAPIRRRSRGAVAASVAAALLVLSFGAAGGRNTGSTYQSFVSGFATTAHDRVTIQFVSGNIVTPELTARRTDGTVDTYQGTYFVHHGVISRFNVHQIG